MSSRPPITSPSMCAQVTASSSARVGSHQRAHRLRHPALPPGTRRPGCGPPMRCSQRRSGERRTGQRHAHHRPGDRRRTTRPPQSRTPRSNRPALWTALVPGSRCDSTGGMDSLPIVLPTAPAASRRAPLPFLAALVPIAAGVVLWTVTGSLLALCFAALGPLMIGGLAQWTPHAPGVASVDRVRSRTKRSGPKPRQSCSAGTVTSARCSAAAPRMRRTAYAQPPLRGAQPLDRDHARRRRRRAGATSEVRCSGGMMPVGGSSANDAVWSRMRRSQCRSVEASVSEGPRPLTQAAARALIVAACVCASAPHNCP